MLRELIAVKNEMDPLIQESYIRLNIIAREVITNRREYDIYGPMIDRVYSDEAIYVKVLSTARDTKSTRVDIKNGFFMIFDAPLRVSSDLVRNRLKAAYQTLEDRYIVELIALCTRFKELTIKTQSVLAKASDMNVEITTNIGTYSSNLKFSISIKYTPKFYIGIDGQRFERENFKSAGSFRDTKTYINLVVPKTTNSTMCERLMDDVENYFING